MANATERQRAVLEEVCDHKGSLSNPSDPETADECVALEWLDHHDGLYVITLAGIDELRGRQGPGAPRRNPYWASTQKPESEG